MRVLQAIEYLNKNASYALGQCETFFKMYFLIAVFIMDLPTTLQQPFNFIYLHRLCIKYKYIYFYMDLLSLCAMLQICFTDFILYRPTCTLKLVYACF